MQWISVKIDEPNVEVFNNKSILVLVNGKPHLCSVMADGYIYITDNRFIYTRKDGWCGDPRFAKPTHWMPIPEISDGMD